MMPSREKNAPPLVVGAVHENVMLETFRNGKVTRPRVRPISHFSHDVYVEFSRRLREESPIGTRFSATVKVCQKHEKDGSEKGPPYLSASNVVVIAASIPDPGLRAKLKPGSISDRAYEYEWDE